MKSKFICVCIALICAMCFFVSCQNNAPSIEEVTITFNSNGGEQVDTLSVEKGKTISLPTPTRENYIFDGWTLDGKPFTKDSIVTSDITLLANWKWDERVWDGTVDSSWYKEELSEFNISTAKEFAGLQKILTKSNLTITININENINLNNIDWTPITLGTHSNIIINGNGHKISNLNINRGDEKTGFFSVSGVSNSIIIKGLSIVNAQVIGDKDDKSENKGVGCFIGYAEASTKITFTNCSIENSIIEGGHWTGGFIGYAAGYNNDGPVYMENYIQNCSIISSTVTGKGSVGGFYGHATGNLWTFVNIDNSLIKNSTITSTGSSIEKAGLFLGTIGTGRVSVTNYIEEKNLENDVKSNKTVIDNRIYGRQGNVPGWLKINDNIIVQGSYDWDLKGQNGYQPN